VADGRPRSDAEREAARLERERRRSGGSANDDETFGESDEPVLEEEPQHHEEEEDEEIAAGTRRVSALHRKPDRARHIRRKQRLASGGGGRHSTRARVAGLIALVVAGFVIWFAVEAFQPFHGGGHGSVTVTIPAHSSSSRIADLLARDGVISSSFFFKVRATIEGDRGKLRAGTYHLKLDMPYGKVLSILTTPPPPAKVTELTLIPGRTRWQIDALLRRQGIRGSYLATTRHSLQLNPVAYGAPRTTPSLEGFLFPNTYQLRDPVNLAVLVRDQLGGFRRAFAAVNLGYARRHHLTPYDVLRIASMVEAEAQTPRDRALVASVIYNRLAQRMPLQIDATTRYAVNNYSTPLTVAQLNSSSPYNTRIHRGLPPTPIDNPGLAAIQAAAHPARTHDLYFVVKPCGNGGMAFSSSYQQFLRDATRYQRARAARGGRSPASCR
jgi:UPF0755 protein